MWIGGHSYTLACAAGEEDQLRQLGNMIDEQVQAARRVAPGLTEIRQLLFAAIYLADKLATAEQRANVAESAAQHMETLVDAAASRVERMADQLALLTAALPDNPGVD